MGKFVVYTNYISVLYNKDRCLTEKGGSYGFSKIFYG